MNSGLCYAMAMAPRLFAASSFDGNCQQRQLLFQIRETETEMILFVYLLLSFLLFVIYLLYGPKGNQRIKTPTFFFFVLFLL